ncbi:MAG TPA: PPOX class F420-dependent oxidoreductase [Actinomycetota bacterium]
MDRPQLSEEERRLFEPPNHAVLATLRPGGSIQVTPVWVGLEGDRVVVNSVRGRAKVRNVERDPRVTVTVMDERDWYRWVSVEGTVVELSEEGAAEHIDRVSRAYEGKPFRALAPGEVRVRLVIEPERVSSEL